METVYNVNLKGRFNDIDNDTWELKWGPFIFIVQFNRYGVQQYVVYLSSPFLNADDNRIYLNYLTDEFGGHESLEKAQRAVETFLSNELKIDFDFLDTNHI